MQIHCCSGWYSLEKYNKITSDLCVASLSTGGSEKYIQSMAIDSGNPITLFFDSQSPLISQEPSISSWVSLIRSQIFHINNIKQILSMITKVLMLRSIILISQNIHKTTTDPSTVKKDHECLHDRQQRKRKQSSWLYFTVQWIVQTRSVFRAAE